MLKNKKSLGLILTLLLVLAFAASAQAEPVQNANGFYQLETAEDMLWFRAQVAAGAVDINAVLVDDIDLSGVVWQPIWYEDLFAEQEFNFAAVDSSDIPYWYAGTFDGNGKTITIDTYNNSTFYFPPNVLHYPHPIHAGGGLFMGISETAVVKNFTLTGKMILAGFPNEANVRIFAAPVVAKNKGTIYNVKVEDFTIENSGASTRSIIGATACLSYGEKAILDGCSSENVAIYSSAANGQMALIAGQVAYYAVIKNSSVADSSIQNGANGVAAGIAAQCREGAVILNCSVSGVDLECHTPTDGTTAYMYLAGIAGEASESSSPIGAPLIFSILNCTVSDVTMTAKKNDVYSYETWAYAGGIVAYANSATPGAPGLIQGCVVSDITVDSAASYLNYAGGLVGRMQNVQILQCRAEELDFTLLHKDAHAVAGGLYAGGIAGLVTGGIQEEIAECLVNGLSVDARSENSVQSVTYHVGSLVGRYTVSSTIADDYYIRNCAVTGNINFDVETDNGLVGNTANIGGLVGSNNGAKFHDNVMGNVTIASADVSGTTTWYIGKLAGALTGYAGVNRGELSGDIYDERLDTTLGAGKLAGVTSGVENTAWYISTSCVSFDGTDLADAATLFASFFKGGELELQQGDILELLLEAFAGLDGIDLDSAAWSSSSPDVLSVTPATGASVTIKALAPGTATLSCTFTLNGEEKTLSLTVNVPEVPEYAVDTSNAVEPVTSGTPDADDIVVGDQVGITYDFGMPAIEAVDVDGAGLLGSGLSVSIVDGKVLLSGKAEKAGNWFYIVTLRYTVNGVEFTQRVPVIIYGGSNPDVRGGGNSNCNAGFGAGAILSLLGLALVLRKK